MHAAAPHLDTDHDDEQPMAVLSRDAAEEEDAHWERAHRLEHYFRPGLEYEDYAPAYCVGYIGFAQYGGKFDDARRSLCANWERIKGDSRLSFDEALPAMRAAWNRMAAQSARPALRSVPNVGTRRRGLAMPSFKLGQGLVR